MPAKAPSAASEFEKRHQERFKGVTFDWKDFQRDGAEFPAPDPTAQPAQQIALRPRGEAAAAKVIADLDLRPAGLTWHPDGRRLAFTADPTGVMRSSTTRPTCGPSRSTAKSRA